MPTSGLRRDARAPRRPEAFLLAGLLLATLGTSWLPTASASPPGWFGLGVVDAVNGFAAKNPFLVFDSDGDAFAFWDEQWTLDIPSYEYAWGASFNRTTGWGTRENLTTAAAEIDWMDAAAACPDGSVVAVGEGDGVQARVFTRAAGWGTSTHIGHDGAYGGPEVVCDSTGVATAVWGEYDDPYSYVMVSRYYPASGWTTKTRISIANEDSEDPSIAVDGAGNVTVAFHSFPAVAQGVYVSRFNESAGWSGAGLIGPDGNLFSSLPRVVADASGNATVVWPGFLAGVNGTTLITVRYRPSFGWSPPFGPDLNSAQPGRVVDLGIDGGGNVIALWAVGDDVYTARLPPVGPWGPAQKLTRWPDLDTRWPHLAVAGNGDAVAVWSAYWNNTSGVEMARFDPATGWGAAEYLVETTPWRAFYPRVAVGGGGRFGVTWHQGSPSDVWATFFAPQAPTIVIWEPQPGATTDVPRVRVSGSVTNAARVAVNGLLVDVQPNGTFSLVVALSPGNNTITGTAWDALGHAAIASVVVRFDDPVPGLGDALEAARADLANLSATLNRTADKLAAAERQLDAASLALIETRADLNATAAELDAAEARLGGAEGAVNNLTGELVAAAEELARVWDSLNGTKASLATAESALGGLADGLAAANATLVELRASFDAQLAEMQTLQAAIAVRAAAEQRLLDDLRAIGDELRGARAQLNERDARLQSTETSMRALETAQGGFFEVLIAMAAGLMVAMAALHRRHERKMRQLFSTFAQRTGPAAERPPQARRGR